MDDLLRPLGLLLLPTPLEEFALRGEVETLRRVGRLALVDPPRLSYRRLVRLPRIVAEILAQTQARRLIKAVRRKGDRPAVVVMFEPEQYLLARAVLSRAPGTELWYRPAAEGDSELHGNALARATLMLEPGTPVDEIVDRLHEAGLADG